MASLIARRAFTTSLRRMTDQGKQQITQDSKRNPETFVRDIPSDDETADNIPRICCNPQSLRAAS